MPDPDQWDDAKQLWAWLQEEEYVAARVLRLHPEVPFSDPGLRRWINNPILMGRTRYSDHRLNHWCLQKSGTKRRTSLPSATLAECEDREESTCSL